MEDSQGYSQRHELPLQDMLEASIVMTLMARGYVDPSEFEIRFAGRRRTLSTRE